MKKYVIKRIAPHGRYDYLCATTPNWEFSPVEEDAIKVSFEQAVLLSYALHNMRIRHYMISTTTAEKEALRGGKIA